MKLKLFILTTLAIFLIPVSVFAASFSIILGKPKSPTNKNNFKLTFVAGDTQEFGRNITVKCFKKGPSDSGYTQFDVNKVLIEGGNTDYCDVTSSILNSIGSYSFYVTAEVPSEPILTSQTVTVDYNTSGPSTPHAYSKERISSCDYKIEFKTANDGVTAKVELFRSETTTISVNSTGRVATLVIGPNTEGEIINSIPNCNIDYYYVIRAVDSSDNVSGTTGDSFTTTTTTTTTTTPTQQALLAGSGSQVAGGATQTEATLSPTGDEASTESATPEVLGTETTKYSILKWIVLTVIAFVIFQLLTRKKRA